MKNKIIGICPVCDNDMFVTNLKCNQCNSELSGEFSLSKFDYLSKEHQYFVEIFIKNRGNIKEIEKDLGISYPTVRKNLDEVILALGYKLEKEEKDENKVNKKAILDKLHKGEITSEEAIKLMKGK